MNEKNMTFEKKFNQRQIKIFALGTMFLNHFAFALLKPGSALFNLFIYIGYFTAITMCYFLVEGFHFTSSRKKYGQRLLIFALVSQIPFDLVATRSGIIQFSGCNMMVTLFICFLILVVKEKIENPPVRQGLVFLLILLSAYGDWGITAPIFTILFYNNYGSKKGMKKAFTIAVLLQAATYFLDTFITTGNYFISIFPAIYASLGPAFSGFVILKLYNGQRGSGGGKIQRWFFYWFYPLHLLGIGLIRVFLKVL